MNINISESHLQIHPTESHLLPAVNCTCSFIKYTISFFLFFFFILTFFYKVDSLLTTSEHALFAKRLSFILFHLFRFKEILFIIFSPACRKLLRS